MYRARTSLPAGSANADVAGPHDLPEPIADAAPPHLLRREIAELPAVQFLVRRGSHSVFLATADQIPLGLYEIGRLREIAFRDAGEGTGRAIDLDPFDAHYLHLVVWSAERAEIVGAYRLAPTDEIVPRFGRDGLYTSTLFDYRTELLARLVPALELGRSFVRLEHQRAYAPLLLLWQAIGEFVVRNPRYKLLFGAVTISARYRRPAEELIVRFLQEKRWLPGLARYVRGKNPPRFDRPTRFAGLEVAFPQDEEELSKRISGIEPDGSRIPVLLKHYLKLGGRFLAFNRDPSFQNALDALVVVDLSTAPARALERFMGPDGLAGFLAYHGIVTDGCRTARATASR